MATSHTALVRQPPCDTPLQSPAGHRGRGAPSLDTRELWGRTEYASVQRVLKERTAGRQAEGQGCAREDGARRGEDGEQSQAVDVDGMATIYSCALDPSSMQSSE